jgi:hypothetical protein
MGKLNGNEAVNKRELHGIFVYKGCWEKALGLKQFVKSQILEALPFNELFREIRGLAAMAR